MGVLQAIGAALATAFAMFWEVLWPLVLGFGLSAVVQALISHRTLARLLGNDSPRNLSLATLFGIASSSCSYAA
ncbi:MAG TPA: permease, partial [Ktedonobacterales bacterium]